MSSLALRFHDHEQFHRAALGMAAAGGIAGLAAHLTVGNLTSPISLALVGAAAALAGLAPATRNAGEIGIRLVLVALAGTALALFTRAGEPTGGLVIAGAAIATALCWGMRGQRMLLAIAGGGLIIVTARHAMTSIEGARELAAMPAWLCAAVAGTAFAFVSVVALIPRHLSLVTNPVGDAYRAVQPGLTGEVRELVDRGHQLWTEASETLPPEGEHAETLQVGILRLFEVAGRWNRTEAEDTGRRAASLAERLADLDDRIAKTEDEVAKQQYVQARAALAEQLKYISNIDTSRERVLARMHNYLAAMERLRLAVINRDSANASRDAEVEPLLSDVESLGRDIDLSCEALAELEG